MNNIEIPFIINLAPTGIIPTRDMNPFVPIKPEEIIIDVNTAAEVGITSVHLHARDEQGHATWRKEVYAEIIKGIRAKHPSLVICVSCSGRCTSTFEERSDVLTLSGHEKPDMASLTLSSLNFSQTASVNSPQSIQKLAYFMKDHGIKPELEIFDLGMANYANYLLNKNILEEPLYTNIMLGNIATAQPTLIEIAAIIHALPTSTIWSFAGIGQFQLSTAALAASYAAGVRIGLEDNLWLDKNRLHLAKNIDLVNRAHTLANTVERPIMTSQAFRQLIKIN